MDDHTASRNVEVLLGEAPHLLERMAEEGVERAWRIDGNDPRRDNEVRADAALVAVLHFPLRGEDDLTPAENLEEAISDLACDLLHLGARRGIDAETVLGRARRHFLAELRDVERHDEANADGAVVGKARSVH